MSLYDDMWRIRWPGGFHISSFFEQKPEIIRDQVICDLGSGNGDVPILLSQMGAKKIYAYDQDAKAIQTIFEQASHRGITNIFPIQHKVTASFKPPRDSDLLIGSDIFYDENTFTVLEDIFVREALNGRKVVAASFDSELEHLKKIGVNLSEQPKINQPHVFVRMFAVNLVL
jgi:predicted nicotinamide N-methyase